MFRVYERFGRRFDPDLVFFEWHSTDPDDNVRSGLYRLENDTLKPGRNQYQPGIRFQDFLMKSHLYRLIAVNSQLYAFIRARVAGSVKRLLVTVEMLPPETRERLKIKPPLAAFAKAARSDLKLYYERGHGHLTPTGVRLLTEQALEAIRASPQLARCTIPLAQGGPQPSGMDLARHKQAWLHNSGAPYNLGPRYLD